MPIIKQKDYKTWKKFDRKRDLQNWLCWFLGTLIFSFCFGLISSKTIWFYVFDSHNEALDLLGRMFPPETNYFLYFNKTYMGYFKYRDYWYNDWNFNCNPISFFIRKQYYPE